jgi:hypothetical protein
MIGTDLLLLLVNALKLNICSNFSLPAPNAIQYSAIFEQLYLKKKQVWVDSTDFQGVTMLIISKGLVI